METALLTALRAAITARGLTIADVATMTGIHRPVLSNMLHGKRSPTLRTLCRVCVALDVTISLTPAEKVG